MSLFSKKNVAGALVLGMFLGLTPALSSQEAPKTKMEKIMSLIRLSGISKDFKLKAQMRVAQFKKANPEVPDELWDEAEKRANINQRIMDVIVQSYDKEFSEEQLVALLKTPELLVPQTKPPAPGEIKPEAVRHFQNTQGKTARLLEELKKKVSAETEEFLKSKGYEIQILPLGILADRIPSSASQNPPGQ